MENIFKRAITLKETLYLLIGILGLITFSNMGNNLIALTVSDLNGNTLENIEITKLLTKNATMIVSFTSSSPIYTPISNLDCSQLFYSQISVPFTAVLPLIGYILMFIGSITTIFTPFIYRNNLRELLKYISVGLFIIAAILIFLYKVSIKDELLKAFPAYTNYVIKFINESCYGFVWSGIKSIIFGIGILALKHIDDNIQLDYCLVWLWGKIKVVFDYIKRFIVFIFEQIVSLFRNNNNKTSR